MANDLELVGGVKTLNPQPSDPRSRRNTIAEVQSDATYYIGYPDIYIVDEDRHYRITGGSVGAWILQAVITEAQVVDVSTLEAYDPLQSYEKDTYRSYVNMDSLDPKFKSPAIYLSMIAVIPGQTPETNPYNPEDGTGIWWYLGERVTVSNRVTSNSLVRNTTELMLLNSPLDGDIVGIISLTLDYEVVYQFDSESFAGTRPSSIPEDQPGRWIAIAVRMMAPMSYSYSFNASFSGINLYQGLNVLKITDPVDPFNINILSYANIKAFARSIYFDLIIDNTANSADISFTFSGTGDFMWGSEGELFIIKAGKKVKYSIISGTINNQPDLNYINHDGGGGSSGHTIKDADESFSQRTGLKFLGNVTVTDNEAGNETIIDVKGGEELISGELSWSGSSWAVLMTNDAVFRRLINTGVSSLVFDTTDIQTASKEVLIRINNSNNTSAISSITFPVTWRWGSGAKPLGLASGAVAVLCLKNITSTEILADWII